MTRFVDGEELRATDRMSIEDADGTDVEIPMGSIVTVRTDPTISREALDIETEEEFDFIEIEFRGHLLLVDSSWFTKVSSLQ
jgi:hypothetical protein